ncbi:Uncharacterised protein [Mycobacterium tuberculosis]|nr:Uncharacterised protein [Mycobacterium tuberculosis]
MTAGPTVTDQPAVATGTAVTAMTAVDLHQDQTVPKLHTL